MALFSALVHEYYKGLIIGAGVFVVLVGGGTIACLIIMDSINKKK